MTRDASADATPARPPYVLAHEPDGRSWTVRENLVDILERELLGPAHGPDEVLAGRAGHRTTWSARSRRCG